MNSITPNKNNQKKNHNSFFLFVDLKYLFFNEDEKINLLKLKFTNFELNTHWVKIICASSI
jgi:hypothetical protein